MDSRLERYRFPQTVSDVFSASLIFDPIRDSKPLPGSGSVRDLDILVVFVTLNSETELSLESLKSCLILSVTFPEFTVTF